MIELTWLRSHIRQLLQDEWNVCRVHVDDDGDVPFQTDTAACWISVVSIRDEPYVRVWAHAAHSIRRSLRLTAELDELNARGGPAKAYWSHGRVIVEFGLHGHGATQKSLAHACEVTSSMAAEVGPLIAAMFGGATPFPAAVTAEEPRDEEAA